MSSTATANSKIKGMMIKQINRIIVENYLE